MMVMWPANRLLGYFFAWFNRAFTATANGYSRLVGGMLKRFVRVLLAYGLLLAVTYYVYAGLPQSARDVLYRTGPPGQASGGLLAAAEQRVADSPRAKQVVDWAKQAVQFPGTPAASSRRRTWATCWSTSSSPTRRRWSGPSTCSTGSTRSRTRSRA